MIANRIGRFLTLVVTMLLVLASCDSESAPAPAVTPTMGSVVPGATATPTGPEGMVMGPTATHGGMVTEATPTGGTVKFEIKSDLQYIEMMVPHHQLAVDMAKLAQQKATRNELKGLAGDIILTQQDEINRMNLWKVELGAVVTTPDPHSMDDLMHMPGMNVDLEALANSPTFDLDLVRAMIPHHQSAIDMSKAALPNLKHEALRGLAQDVIVSQQVEIDRMQKWLGEWK